MTEYQGSGIPTRNHILRGCALLIHRFAVASRGFAADSPDSHGFAVELGFAEIRGDSRRIRGRFAPRIRVAYPSRVGFGRAVRCALLEGSRRHVAAYCSNQAVEAAQWT